MATPRRFSKPDLEMIDKARIAGVRSGTAHRHTGVWIVVVEGRAFVRSWNNKPTGWYGAFREEPNGSLSIGGKEFEVRALHVRSERIRRAVSLAYAGKYNTKASEKWVRGFEEPERERTTLELVPV